MQGQNHTSNKVFLVGLAGGLALIAALFYPLYVLLPGRYVHGWPTGWGIVGLALEIAAALLAVATGLLAARWVKAGTRRGGTLFGALAGGVAGVVLFCGIGAPAASVTGAAPLLERGLVPAAGQADVVRLLAESTVGIVWWSYGAFWAALLAGTGLGAVGGMLARPAIAPSHRHDLRLTARAILTAAVIVGALSFLAAVTKFALLEPTIRDGLVLSGVSLDAALPLATISDWLIGTPLLLYMASLVALYFLVRVEIRSADEPARLGAARATAQFLGLVSLGVPVYLAAMGSPALSKGGTVVPRGWMDVAGLFHPSPVSPGGAIGPLLLSLGLVGSLFLGGLYLNAVNAAYRRQRAWGLYPPHPVQSMAVVGILLSPGIIDWAIALSTAHSPVSQFMGVLVGLAMVVVDVVLIVGLLRVPRQSLSYTITLAQMRLALSQLIRGGLGAVVAMVIPPMTVLTAQVGLGLITNQLVEVLVGREFAAQEFTLVELVRDVYLTQASVFLMAFVAATAVIGLLTLVISGMMALPAQLGAQNAEAAQ